MIAPTGGELLELSDVLGNDVPELGAGVLEVPCEIFVAEDGLGSDEVVDEDVE